MKSKRTIWIPVVAGFIKKEDQVLLGQRPLGNTLPGQWEFPGGKVELGESPEQALKRELEEELGINAEIGRLRYAITHAYGDKGVLILFYDVDFWKGEPKQNHHQGLKWVAYDNLLSTDIPEANKKVLPKLIEILKNE